MDSIFCNSDEEDNDTSAHVQHSMKKTYPLEVCVVISDTSRSVKHGTCNCIASALGRCVHVTALLLHLRDYVKDNGHQVNIPSTNGRS